MVSLDNWQKHTYCAMCYVRCAMYDTITSKFTTVYPFIMNVCEVLEANILYPKVRSTHNESNCQFYVFIHPHTKNELHAGDTLFLNAKLTQIFALLLLSVTVLHDTYYLHR